MSINQLAIGKLALALSVVFAAVTAPNTASAGHSSYVYTGKAFGFHGEANMINALRYMERGYLSHECRSRYFRHAEDQIRLARYAVASRHARTYLRNADRYLDEYQWSGNVHYLDEAARMVEIALENERHTHHQVALPVTYYTAPNTGHGYYAPHGTPHGSNITIHGRWGHVGVRF